jgi:hypothetical protein
MGLEPDNIGLIVNLAPLIVLVSLIMGWKKQSD